MMGGSYVRDTDKGFRHVVKEFRSGNLQAAAGYPVGTTGSLVSEGTTPIWKYMLYNQYGAPEANITARPFMSDAFDDNLSKYNSIVDSGVNGVAKGGSLKQTLTRVAVEMHNDIKRQIANGDYAENKESTKARKGSSQPLFDLGAALSAVAFEVRTPRK